MSEQFLLKSLFDVGRVVQVVAHGARLAKQDAVKGAGNLAHGEIAQSRISYTAPQSIRPEILQRRICFQLLADSMH